VEELIVSDELGQYWSSLPIMCENYFQNYYLEETRFINWYFSS